MGMYTELIFGARLKKETPQEVIDTLRYMIEPDFPKPENFVFENHRNILRGAGSYYFGVISSVSKIWFDGIAKSWIISSRNNIKNYEGEIEMFLEWIKPYIYSGSGTREMYAIVTYEESEEPTIYYLYDNDEI